MIWWMLLSGKEIDMVVAKLIAFGFISAFAIVVAMSLWEWAKNR